MITQLNILILPETDPRFLSIADRSVYNPDIPVTESILQITAPGFNFPNSFYYQPNKILTVNSNLLKLSNANTVENLCALPDGTYTIKQQICPHDKLFAEYYYFRTVLAEEKLNKLRCSLETCNTNTKEFKEKMSNISEIDFYLTQAKVAAESCGLLDKSKEFYKMATKLLNKSESNCSTC